ncbi:hypothetical protein OU995_23320 [Roseateles sp. SL47]|uniref:hypothetical protein n=1 Tax=Roseateles sp. SL47 TaxID=2995138 RepID=UPI00226F4D88|nr:hypothetical protein [Roseateles sp. SL47]WAC72448.1 hypothetical protein OU995_23320 [Roseateles sp. SL47]
MTLHRISVGWLSVLCMGGALAQAPQASMEERLRTQLRATTSQLQQVQNELATLKAAQAAPGAGTSEMKSGTAAARAGDAQIEALKRELSQARAMLAEERAARARDDQQGEEARRSAQTATERAATQVGQFRDAYNEVLRMARSAEAERARLAAGVQVQEQALQQCDLKNRELYRVGQEILQTYETLDTRKVLESRHVFAAKARVKYDEIAQRFGDQLHAGRFDPVNPMGPGAAEQ